MISVFLPVRSGSERVKNKNTRPFAKFSSGLLELKIKQLIDVEELFEIVISTNCPNCISIIKSLKEFDKRIVLDIRPDELCSSDTSLLDLVNYVPRICKGDHILWTHVTSPFVNSVDYSSIIGIYKDKIANKSCDSLMTVKSIRNFIWSKELNDLINRNNLEKWPRTQDLKIYYEIDSAVFLAPINIYRAENDRIGREPFLYELSGNKSFDIDWEDDFRLAEIMYLNNVS